MRFHMPVKLYFGPGEIQNLTRILSHELKVKNPIIVTDKGIAASGLLGTVTRMLPGIRVFDAIEANPKSDTVNAIAQELRQIKPDLIIGLGGGSPLDAGKALALLATNAGKIEDYEGREKYINDPLPFLAIPTTCGTGSEVTWVSVITDVTRKFKMSIKGPKLYPAVSIVDPDLLKTLPKAMIAATGLDALTHAVEAYLSKPATPITDTNALAAVQLILGAVEGAFTDIENNHCDRENLMYGSTIAGFAFGNSDVTAVHCISESIGALYDVPHGVANSIFLPHVLAYNLVACMEKMADLARKSGFSAVDDRVAAQLFITHITQLSKRLGIPSFKDLNIARNQFETIADMSFCNNSNSSNPRPLEQTDYLKILESAFVNNKECCGGV
ncbi:MAG: iron-containing alcohol dehydrogenase [Proteobacteria bacterium]|nr:iron-containing alcohol dehydrogenase [Desulfobacula sp.]MBU3951589.1 iron-containing alcohol dehydrogenase [Pseudomonadota bacterium]MBU4130165.1 iron-containing alcohol dehydrogenase [Pseudomonadota bacterium]